MGLMGDISDEIKAKKTGRSIESVRAERYTKNARNLIGILKKKKEQAELTTKFRLYLPAICSVMIFIFSFFSMPPIWAALINVLMWVATITYYKFKGL